MPIHHANPVHQETHTVTDLLQWAMVDRYCVWYGNVKTWLKCGIFVSLPIKIFVLSKFAKCQKVQTQLTIVWLSWTWRKCPCFRKTVLAEKKFPIRSVQSATFNEHVKCGGRVKCYCFITLLFQLGRCLSVIYKFVVVRLFRSVSSRYLCVWHLSTSLACTLVPDVCFRRRVFSLLHRKCISHAFSVLILVLLWFLWLCCAFGGGDCDIIELTGHLPSNQLSPVSHSRGLSLPGFVCQLCYNTFCGDFIIQKEGILKWKLKTTLVSIMIEAA